MTGLIMYDLLDIVLSVVVYLSPHDVKAIQIWPYAADSKKEMRESSLTWRKDGDQWCSLGDCMTVTDGKLLDEHGKVLLTIKNHLQVTNGTNYAFTQRGWEKPEKFSMTKEKDERMIVFSDGTNVIRQIRVKLWKTEPPVEFASCAPKHTNDLVILREKLQAENIHCTEIRSGPAGRVFGFYVDPKDFNRARTIAAKIIGEKSLTVTTDLDTRSEAVEDWENGKKVGERHF